MVRVSSCAPRITDQHLEYFLSPVSAGSPPFSETKYYPQIVFFPSNTCDCRWFLALNLTYDARRFPPLLGGEGRGEVDSQLISVPFSDGGKFTSVGRV